MSNPNDPAYPCDVPRIGEEQGEFFTGMTIRQRFVMAAMQGLLASCADQVSDPTTLGVDAVRCADFALTEEARTRSTT